MTKAELRKLYRAKRNELSQGQYEELNKQLLQQFSRLDLSGVECIHLFLPIYKRKEPDTFLIRDWLAVNHPGILRVLPKANFADSTMQHYADDDQLELAFNAFDIPEPVSGNIIDPTQIDMVLVPLLAFDKQGYRLGYGKGFYDRFMVQCKPGTRFIGLSFFDPVDVIDDVTDLDQQITGYILPASSGQLQQI